MTDLEARLQKIRRRPRSLPRLGFAALCAVCSGLTLLLIGSLLPIWTAWHFTTWEGVGSRATFWKALSDFPDTVQNVGVSLKLWDLYREDLIQGVILLAVSTVTGLLVFRRLSKSPSHSDPFES
jgi:hypothetical protein